ncbi:hypothetical protein E2562_023488 [Oryza meyeriana var. granulata]|uniref:Uncharacterized protein n=1 Tax=Oryza meyeriana var. granulata TaxID=110450 RepID=A0A6G1BY33_9ORYZ|nr:hypothetical protein E2562_023488 [Oryza meyeriana var. granulata]
MDKINPETMCIEISLTKTIKITPFKITIVMGTLFGSEELRLPDGKVMGVASKQLAQDLGLQPNSKISPSRLIHDPNAIRFFIMVMTNTLLLPTIDFYIMQKDAYLENDLATVECGVRQVCISVLRTHCGGVLVLHTPSGDRDDIIA